MTVTSVVLRILQRMETDWREGRLRTERTLSGDRSREQDWIHSRSKPDPGHGPIPYTNKCFNTNIYK